jgi:hypothetical protein
MSHLPKPFPDVPLGLLEHLERHYPDRAPDLDTPEREVWAKAGEARLIRKLRHHFDEQTGGPSRKT